MGINQKFTRIPKVPDLLAAGVPTEVIPTYCALADYASNKTGLCWPKMETIAAILGRSVRTIQRHLHLLKDKGLVEFVERRRNRGRFSSYLYKVVHFVELIPHKKRAPTSGHKQPLTKRPPNIIRTRHVPNTPLTPQKDPKEGYWPLFGEEAPPEAQEQHCREAVQRREEEARRRTEGYRWLFQ